VSSGPDAPVRTWRRFKRRLFRRGIRFTRQGKMYTAVTLGVGLAAVNTDNNLLFLVLGLMLGLIIVSGIMSELSLMGLRIDRRMATHAEAGTVFPVELSVANGKRFFASFGVELRDEINGRPFRRRAFFLRIGPKEERSIAYRCEIPQRGQARFSGTIISTRFPFGLFEKTRFVKVTGAVMMLPKQIPVVIPRPPTLLGEGEGNPASRLHGQEFRELREISPGDDPRLIDWRATARVGTLMVRENESDQAGFLELVLDPAAETDGDAPDPAAEERISATATIINRMLREGVGIRLVTTPNISLEYQTEQGLLPMMEYLALIDTRKARTAPAPLGRHAVSVLIGPRAGTRGLGRELPIPPFFRARRDT
jgi:uncharacterized protein (DUF58 family)